jgi:hypothetical protein
LLFDPVYEIAQAFRTLLTDYDRRVADGRPMSIIERDARAMIGRHADMLERSVHSPYRSID